MEDPKVLSKLKRSYSKAYGLLCKEHGEDVSHVSPEILSALRTNIEEYGDEPIQFLRQVHAQITQLPEEPLLKQMVDWGKESMKIEDLAQQTDGNTRGIDSAKDVSKQLLNELRYGEISHDELQSKLIEKYMEKIYKAEFEKKVELHSGEIRERVLTNLERVTPLVIEGISYFAKQSVKKGSISSLRLPSREKPEVSLDVDLDEL